MRIELRCLRYFLQVAKSGSFSRAAETLYIAQSALSRQVKRLEVEIGTPLFIRHPRGVDLTPAGSELRGRAEKLLREADTIADNLTGMPSAAEGKIVIGLPPVLGQRLGAQLISEFRRLWPRYTVQIRLAGSAALYDWLESGQIELALLSNSPPLDGLRNEPILYESLHVILPAGANHPDSFTIKSLAELPLILPSWPDNDRRLIENAAQRHAIRINPVIEIDSIPLTRSSVAQGLGVAVLPYSAVQDEVEQGLLSAVPIIGPVLKSTLAIATSKDVQASLVMAGLKRSIIQSISKAMEDELWQGATMKNDSKRQTQAMHSKVTDLRKV